MAFFKFCPGCKRQIQKNRTFKRHVLGYTKKDGRVICTPCPENPEYARDAIAHQYTLDKHQEEREAA